jgi:mRNA interferase RelE/StbE
MTEYKVQITSTAERHLKRLSKADQRRVVSVVTGLTDDPRPRGCRKLRGYDDVFRVRVGVLRILYAIEEDRLLILVLKVGHRKAVYR